MQFDCARCDELLLDFAYGELDEVTAAAFRRHADSCGRCTAALADVRTVREAFSMLSLEHPSPAIDARILAAADQRLAEIDDKKRATLRHESRSIIAKLFDVFRVAALRPQYAMAVMIVLVVGVGLVVAPQLRLSEPAPGAAPDIAARSTNEVAPLPLAPTTLAPAAPAPPPATEMGDEGAQAQAVLPEPPSRGPVARVLAEQEAERSADVAQRGHASGRGRAPSLDTDAPAAERTRRENAPVTVVAGPRPAPQRMLTRGGGGANADEDDSGRLGFTQTPAETPALATPGRRSLAVAEPAPADRQDAREARRQTEQRAWAQAPAPSPPMPAPRQPVQSSSQSGGSYGQGGARDAVAARPEQQQQQGGPAGSDALVVAGDAYARGMSRYQAGLFRQALPDLESAVARPGLTGDALAAAHLAIARSYYRIQNYSEGARRYEELIRRFATYRSNAAVAWEAAECNRLVGNTQRADQLYRAAERSAAYGERARARRVQMDGARRAAPAFDAAEAAEQPAAVESGSAH